MFLKRFSHKLNPSVLHIWKALCMRFTKVYLNYLAGYYGLWTLIDGTGAGTCPIAPCDLKSESTELAQSHRKSRYLYLCDYCPIERDNSMWLRKIGFINFDTDDPWILSQRSQCWLQLILNQSYERKTIWLTLTVLLGNSSMDQKKI